MLRDLFRETYAAIPATVPRTHIVAAVESYLASYATHDLGGRAQLFAPISPCSAHGLGACAPRLGNSGVSGQDICAPRWTLWGQCAGERRAAFLD